MLYVTEIEGFEGHEIAFELKGLFGAPRLLFDGVPPMPGNLPNTFALTRNDGKAATAQLKPVALGSSINVVIDGMEYVVMPPLAWYEWAWVGIPFLLVIGGGCLGGALGGGVSVLNLRIFRTQESAALRYGISGALSLIALVLFLVAASFLQLLIGKSTSDKNPPPQKNPVAARKETGPMAPGSPRMDQHLRELLNAPSTVVDAKLIQQFDEHLAKSKDPQRQSLKLLLNSRICRDAEKLGEDWVCQHLMDILKETPSLQDEAATALVKRGESALLLPLFSSLETRTKKNLCRPLKKKDTSGETFSPSNLKLAFLILKDSDPTVRDEAFDLLCERTTEKPEIQTEIFACLRDEKDEKLRSEWERKLVRAFANQRSRLKPLDYLELLSKNPCQSLTKEAIERLSHDHANRKSHFSLLSDQFKQIIESNNRIWIMRELKGFMLRPDIFALYEMGMADGTPAVRAAAVAGRLETLNEMGPDVERLRQILQTETDSDAKNQMTQAFQLWTIRQLGHQRSRPATRSEAHRQLAELAAVPDEEVATAALNQFSLLQSSDAETVSSLLNLLKQTSSPARKIKILGKMDQLADDSILDFCRTGLADHSVDVRRAAFITLSNNYRHRQMTPPASLELMKSSAEIEKDPSLQKRMTEILGSLDKK